MITFLVKRTLLAAISLLAITVFTYAIIQMPPGDYVDSYIQLFLVESLGATAQFSSEDMDESGEALRKKWGLDRPLVYQYWKWISNVVRGGYVNRCVNDIRRRPSQPLSQRRSHPRIERRDRRLRSTQGPSDA